jgi:D-alanyl-D-alanine-carboxypeptidase/D-alanyl-D-alanine-endopeptidase
MARWFLLIACAALTLPANPAPAQPRGATPAAAIDPAAFDATAAERDSLAVMARGRIPGAQAVVVSTEGVVWRRTFGLADREAGLPMTFDTLVQAGSVTKVFTASILADMVSRGELSWSDTLAQVLPGVPMRKDVGTISLAELVSHTGGLPANPPNRIDVDGVWRPYSKAELYAALNDNSFAVGGDWNYSNFGFAILGHVIEMISGKNYETVLRERIFGPLGMRHTQIVIAARDEAKLAIHYWPEDTPLRPRPRWRFGEIAGFGGITTNADDLAIFLRYQMNPAGWPTVLNARAVAGLRTIRILFPDWRVGVGRPWFERRDADGTVTVEHGGEVDGHSAMMMFSPAQGVGVAVLANMGQSAAEDIARPLLSRAVAAARARAPPKEKPHRF